MKGSVDYFNKTAKSLSDEASEGKNDEVLSKFYSCFSEAGTKKPRLLDIGCGAGYESKVLSNLGAKVLGIDISGKLTLAAKAEVKSAKFVAGDITESLTDLGSFDGIVCLATITFVDVQKMQSTFENMSQVLKKGGLLLVSSYDGSGKNIEKSYVKVDGEEYDIGFNNYSASELCAFAYPKFKLVDTWKFKDFDEGWRYYIFIKL